jgi:formamidopyrimidine-DNA glycosylase
MPELPEVETSCRGIEPYCLNQSITKIIVRQAKLRWPVDKDISLQLSGKVISLVNRRGKYILLQLEPSLALMIHLGMSGSLRIVEKSRRASPEIGKHDHVDIELSNGKILRYNDPRRFGSILINREGEQHLRLKELGLEPLTEDFTADYLYRQCRSRSSPIKSVIMNSQLVVGVGNIYAQEALFMAGISPIRQANKISLKRISALVAAIKLILQQAIAAGGSSLKDFTAADGKPGYFQQTLKVYGRGGEACPVCDRTLKQVSIAQRTTAYCSHCQT